ncbi:RidA family protein [Devosia alba]|uniref:RidA family protein n=1 Tax=Devosia alba TaxID=3152360 RepID=UPI00326331BD
MTTPTLLNPNTLPQTESIGYSQIAIAHTGRMAFVSGQVAISDDELPVSGSLDAQADIVIENLSRALAALDGAARDIIQLRIYIVDLKPSSVEIVMGKLATFLNGARPGLTGVGVQSLASPEFLLEIEMVVQLPGE